MIYRVAHMLDAGERYAKKTPQNRQSQVLSSTAPTCHPQSYEQHLCGAVCSTHHHTQDESMTHVPSISPCSKLVLTSTAHATHGMTCTEANSSWQAHCTVKHERCTVWDHGYDMLMQDIGCMQGVHSAHEPSAAQSISHAYNIDRNP